MDEPLAELVACLRRDARLPDQDLVRLTAATRAGGNRWDVIVAACGIKTYTRSTIETELNSSPANPAVVLAERRVVPVGNLDVVPVAAALDFARIALAPVGDQRRRTNRQAPAEPAVWPPGRACRRSPSRS